MFTYNKVKNKPQLLRAMTSLDWAEFEELLKHFQTAWEAYVTEGEEFELFKLIRQHGLKREFPLIVSTVKAFSEGRVKVAEGRIVDASGKSMPGYDLTAEIDRMVSAE